MSFFIHAMKENYDFSLLGNAAGAVAGQAVESASASKASVVTSRNLQAVDAQLPPAGASGGYQREQVEAAIRQAYAGELLDADGQPLQAAELDRLTELVNDPSKRAALQTEVSSVQASSRGVADSLKQMGGAAGGIANEERRRDNDAADTERIVTDMEERLRSR